MITYVYLYTDLHKKKAAFVILSLGTLSAIFSNRYKLEQ